MELSKAEVSHHKVFRGSEANQVAAAPGAGSVTLDEPMGWSAAHTCPLEAGHGVLVRLHASSHASSHASDGHPVWVPPEAGTEKETLVQGVDFVNHRKYQLPFGSGEVIQGRGGSQ